MYAHLVATTQMLHFIVRSRPPVPCCFHLPETDTKLANF